VRGWASDGGILGGGTVQRGVCSGELCLHGGVFLRDAIPLLGDMCGGVC
jgi:hypothetical protein